MMWSCSALGTFRFAWLSCHFAGKDSIQGAAALADFGCSWTFTWLVG